MIGTICQVAFGLNFLASNLWAVVMLKLLVMLPLSKAKREGYGLLITQAAWRWILLLTPWMWTTSDDQSAGEWSKILKTMADAKPDSGAPKPLMILGNHMCFFDTILATASFPQKVLYNCRTYMDAALFKLPILSTICKTVGHFPVYFTAAGTDGKFTVDKEKNAVVDLSVDEHLKSGGWLCFFPEGQMNTTPDTLMTFRYGGMKKALDYDSRLVAFVSCGNTAVWPKKAKIGGFPGYVKHSMRPIAPDGCRAFVAQIRAQPDLPAEDRDSADYELLAKYARVKMQQQYDELKLALGGGSSKTIKGD